MYVFETASGVKIACCKAIRVSAPVRACGVSDDCRHVLAVLGNGYVFRYEFRAPKVRNVAGAVECSNLGLQGDSEDGTDNDKENMDFNCEEMDDA